MYSLRDELASELDEIRSAGLFKAERVIGSPQQANVRVGSDESVTIFIDAHFGMRKDHLAGQLTKSHADFAARGYRYVDMAPYNENGDLVGFFVTYTRN